MTLEQPRYGREAMFLNSRLSVNEFSVSAARGAGRNPSFSGIGFHAGVIVATPDRALPGRTSRQAHKG